jgi:hypothetical protein
MSLFAGSISVDSNNLGLNILFLIEWAGCVAQLVESLPSKHKTQYCQKIALEGWVAVYAYNLNHLEDRDQKDHGSMPHSLKVSKTPSKQTWWYTSIIPDANKT